VYQQFDTNPAERSYWERIQQPLEGAVAALREAQTGWALLSAAFPDHEEFREQAARLAEALETLGDSSANSNPDAGPD